MHMFHVEHFAEKGLLKPPKLCYTKTQRCKQKKLPLKS